MTIQNDPKFQTTVNRAGGLAGVGVHSGEPASVRLLPAPADHGIVLQRVDLADRPKMPALASYVVANELCTVLGISSEATVSTIEHLMAALAAARIDNVLVEIDGPEMPILDGCSDAFMTLIDSLGRRVLAGPRRALRILKPVTVTRGDSVAEFLPFQGTRYEVTIDFPSEMIGRQSIVFDLTGGAFKRELAQARTFGLLSDFDKAKAVGFCKGSSLENSVGVGETEVHAKDGLRWSDEFVRHKTLDAVGDLALAGMPFIGLFRSYKGGHRLNVDLVRALLADTSAYEIVCAQEDDLEEVDALLVANG